MGTPEFALPSLKILIDKHYDIPGVVTAPDKPQGRGQKVSGSPIKEFALRRRLTVLQPTDLKEPKFLADVSSLQPDLIAVVAFRILPPEVFTIAKKGAFNLHASLLPKYRGAAPINRAIINGETETGVTAFFLKEKVDTGSIILQARVKIGPDETAGELQDKLSNVGAEIILQTVRLIELEKAHPREQDETQATAAPKIFKEDCNIPWNKPAPDVHNFVRGLSPVPAAWTRHKGATIKIFRTSLEVPSDSQRQGLPGEVTSVSEDSFVVQTSRGHLSVREVQQEARRRMTTADFLRGYSLAAGDKFE